MIRPRHVVCLLGRWRSLDALEDLVARLTGDGLEVDRELSVLEADPRMKRSFELAADRRSPSITDDDRHAIEQHTAVAYVLSPPLPRGGERELSRRMLSVIAAALEDGGALAVKGESSGIAHGHERWLELARQSASSEPFVAELALERAWVRQPLVDREVYYSCGMHLLGEPDVEVPVSVEPHEAADWIATLALYLLTEKPEGGVGDGHTFRRNPSDARRVLRAHPCRRYPEDDFFFNPFGYLRITDEVR